MADLPHLTPNEQAAYAALTHPDIDVTTGVGLKTAVHLNNDAERRRAAGQAITPFREAFTPAAMVALYQQLSAERAESARLRGLLNDVLKR